MSTVGLEGSILNRFMSVGTCSPCVQLGDHISLCMQFAPIWGISVSEVACNSLVTWVPENRVAIILIALGNNCTAVWVADTGKIYYATETISLPSEVPAGTVLLANYTEDVKGSYREPRVLVYDVVAWGSSTNPYGYDNMRSVSAEDRYRKLREELGPLLQADKTLKASLENQPSNTIVLQWVGFKEGALQFLYGGLAVGHSVATLVQLSDEDAVMPLILEC
ncbi:hypothetical protein T484DRAFT_1757746 [Baffinella frigidus]|nr:hypothetical protein T484DRAFT_1757746 [Cryptophyta sp. CCMP2293]